MSRELKFRAWNKNANRYSKPFGIKSTVLNFTDDDGLGIMKSLSNEEVEQFTGFKDVNGKEIYEGDIVRSIKGFYSSKIAKVVWMEKRCAFYFISNGCGTDIVNRNPHESAYKINSYKVEVIGNIHETPELLQS